MPNGIPRTQEERNARHTRIYGTSSPPPANRMGRGIGMDARPPPEYPSERLGTGEDGRITNVLFPASAKKGSEITVTTTVLNTGTKTAEFRVYLKNAEGKTIDKEPDTYRSVKPGQSSIIKTSTHWDPRWAMPGYDWNNLRVELWELDWGIPKTRHDARVFSIKLDTGMPEENGRITKVVSPKSAKKGTEIEVLTTVENTGTKNAEFRVYLKSPGGATIDKEPDTYRSVKPGQTTTIKTSTHWDPRWAMPGRDWKNLRVELWEIDLIGKSKLDDRIFSIKLETIADIVPGLTTPLPVTPDDAATGYTTGTRYEIKFGIPILSMLPGIPYTPGMWVPWGFVITEVPEE